VIKVVAIVVVVICLLIVVMGASFFMGVLSLIDESPEEQNVINFQAPRVSQRQVSNVTVWDATLEVDRVTPRESGVWWDTLQLSVLSREGDVLFAYHNPAIDDPQSYDDATNGWVDVEAWYIDLENNTLLRQGDIIKITGMDERYQGATIMIREKGTQTVTLQLPLNFP